MQMLGNQQQRPPVLNEVDFGNKLNLEEKVYGEGSRSRSQDKDSNHISSKDSNHISSNLMKLVEHFAGSEKSQQKRILFDYCSRILSR